MPFDFDSLPENAKRWWFAQVNPGGGRAKGEGSGQQKNATEKEIERARSQYESLSPREQAFRNARLQEKKRQERLQKHQKAFEEVVRAFEGHLAKMEQQKRFDPAQKTLKPPDPWWMHSRFQKPMELLLPLARDKMRDQLERLHGYLEGKPEVPLPKGFGYWVGESPRNRELRLLAQLNPPLPSLRDTVSGNPAQHIFSEPQGPNMTHPFLGRYYVKTGRTQYPPLPKWLEQFTGIRPYHGVEIPMDWLDPGGSLTDAVQIPYKVLKDYWDIFQKMRQGDRSSTGSQKRVKRP